MSRNAVDNPSIRTRFKPIPGTIPRNRTPASVAEVFKRAAKRKMAKARRALLDQGIRKKRTKFGSTRGRPGTRTRSCPKKLAKALAERVAVADPESKTLPTGAKDLAC